MELSTLRMLIGDNTMPYEFDDDTLTTLLAAAADSDVAIGQIWRMKAASVASLVDISESGSSRSNSQLARTYADIAKAYEAKATDEQTETGARIPAKVGRIVRTRLDFP